jgi:hypothetical protein
MDATFSALFEQLWNQYPDRVGKKAAAKHFEASVHTMADVDNIRKALANYKASDRVRRGFVQNGSTWFNNWRDWIDYVEPQKGSRSVGGQDFEGTER